MFYNQLGKTTIKVSALGLGTVKLGRNENIKYPNSFNIPDDKKASDLLSHAHSLGINFIDTAPAYGTAESRLGHLLKGQRDQWILSSKVGEIFENGQSHFDFSTSHAIQSIEQSLQHLQTDYLDLILIHSDGNDKKILNTDLCSTLQQLKKTGKVRAIGMSSKTIEGSLLAMEVCDVLMLEYNPINTEMQPVINLAAKQSCGVLIKKALASGHIDKLSKADPVVHAFDFIYQSPGISSIVLGTINPVHLEYAANCIGQIGSKRHIFGIS